MSAPDVIFYGVASGHRAGHYLHDGRGGWVRESDLPAALFPVDGAWCRPRHFTSEECRDRWKLREPEVQGRGFIHHVQGWTIISWWDRSEDARGGCCAVFLLRGRLRWAQALARARECFPREIARMERAYGIFLAGENLPDEAPQP